MPRYVSGGPFPMRVDRDGTAHHAVTDEEVFYCLKCPFGSPAGMFRNMEQLRAHDMMYHPMQSPALPDTQSVPRKRGRPKKERAT